MKSLWSDVREVYGSAWAFALTCPILFLIPVIAEFAQHVVEVNLGLYDSVAGAKAAENDPARMAWGFAKTLAITLPTYWFYRYVVSGRDAAYARRLDPRSVILWGVIFLVMAVGFGGLSMFGPDLGSLLGLEGKAAMAVKGALTAFEMVIGIYFTAWYVAWSQGNSAIGPLRSARIMGGFFWRTVALLIAGIVPLMALHYAGLVAIGQPRALVWVMMLFDSFVVGFLALTMAGANAVAAMRAAGAKGVSLMPDGGSMAGRMETPAAA